jgi:hypothetical protein
LLRCKKTRLSVLIADRGRCGSRRQTVCLFDQEYDALFHALSDLDLVADFPDQVGNVDPTADRCSGLPAGRPAAALSAPFASSMPATDISAR